MNAMPRIRALFAAPACVDLDAARELVRKLDYLSKAYDNQAVNISREEIDLLARALGMKVKP